MTEPTDRHTRDTRARQAKNARRLAIRDRAEKIVARARAARDPGHHPTEPLPATGR